MNQEYLLKHPELFQYVIGIKFSQFNELLPKFPNTLRKAEYLEIWGKQRIREPGGGRKAKLQTDSDKLFFILFYYKTYPTFRFASVLYSLDKRNIQLWVRFLAPILFTERLNPHLKMVLPQKKPPGNDLTDTEELNNKAIPSIRVRVEHPFSYLKHFNILRDKFRGRVTNQQNLDLPFKTIAAIYNFTRPPI